MMAIQSAVDWQSDDAIRSPLHESLVGHSEAIQAVRDLIQKLAKSNLTVLVTGESGTGKDIAARLLHRYSPRHSKPFIKVNCPAIPESILESELFGYERGAFTGARTTKPGRFELAHLGTIFLDEIAETSPTVQGKLLQVLDGEPVLRIGGVQAVQVDVRVIAATNIPLERAVGDGHMREDIYYRLSEVVIEMPALRNRLEDLPLLAEHFNYNFRQRLGMDYVPIAQALIKKMQDQEWPGNIRELAARVRKFAATSNPHDLLYDAPETAAPAADTVSPATMQAEFVVSPDVSNGPAGKLQPKDERKQFTPLKEAVKRAVEETERNLIEDALRYTLWNRRKAAKLLKVSYSSLLRRMEAYGIGKKTMG
ncbi:MAG: hypothetical protein AMXMBFR84_24190 [Candidatus Hydrogenedentota bacterium]